MTYLMRVKFAAFAIIFCGLSSSSVAFTLDFLPITSSPTLAPTFTVIIPGYGNVRFDIVLNKLVFDIQPVKKIEKNN